MILCENALPYASPTTKKKKLADDVREDKVNKSKKAKRWLEAKKIYVLDKLKHEMLNSGKGKI